MKRQINHKVTGYQAQEGAGVLLVRVLGLQTVDRFDPFLLLDSFDSDNPDEYKAGFPMHPHRGIETISYVCKGAMTHRDSLGNEDTVRAGEVQWMTAGSGILHEEMLPAEDGMLGIQLWLNMPAGRKMSDPDYKAIKHHEIMEISFPGGRLRLLAGHYGEHSGFQGKHLPLDYYDIHLEANEEIEIPTDPAKSVLLFTLKGNATIGGEKVVEKTAVQTTPGESVVIGTANGRPAQVLYMASDRLDEEVSWAGPIVMNTREELQQAFDDLQTGHFIRKQVEY